MKTIGIDVMKDSFPFVIAENGEEVEKGIFKSTTELEEKVISEGIEPEDVFIDSGYQTTLIYSLCERNGYTATKGTCLKEDHKKYRKVKGGIDLLMIYFRERQDNRGKDIFCDCRVLAFAAFT